VVAFSLSKPDIHHCLREDKLCWKVAWVSVALDKRAQVLHVFVGVVFLRKSSCQSPFGRIVGDAGKLLQEINGRGPIFTTGAQRLISSRFSHTLLTIIDKACSAAGGAVVWLHRAKANQRRRS
jgi:hypothetical protein